MDTGFNYYHGADPSEYDLLVSNSEGGLERLRELGARRAEAVFWGADPEFFAPQPVEKENDVFFYGYGDKFRRDWMRGDRRRAVRARCPRSTSRSAAATSRATPAAPRLIGDVPFNVFARAISAARINLCITRRSHATVYALVVVPAVRARVGGRRDRLEPVRGDRALVRARAASCSSSTTPTRRSPPTASCSTIPAQAEELGARARERVLDEHTYRHRARQLLALVGLGARQARVPERPPRRDRSGAQRGGRDRPGDRRAPRVRPGLDVVVVDDGSTTDGRRRGGSRRAPSCGCRSTSASAAPCRRASATRSSTASTRSSGSTATGSTTRSSSRTCSSRSSRRGRHRRRLALRRGAGGYRPPSPRRVGIRVRALVSLLVAPARHRHHVRLPGAEPAGDRALRGRLSARLPRGRGDRDGREAPAAPARGAGADARARAGRSSITMLRSLYYMAKVPLALFVGLFRRASSRRRSELDPGRRSRSRSPRRSRRSCSSSSSSS